MKDDLLLPRDSDALPEPIPEGAEGEDDLDRAGFAKLTEAVVAATDWTTETLLRQLERRNILLNPRFQRRDAWRTARKSKFIESLLLGLPIPQIVLAEDKAKKGTYIVIDGKQRLLALRQFAADENDQVYPVLHLESLEIRSELIGHSLRSLQANPVFAADVSAFENQTIRTVVIKNWQDESVLYLIFLRLNTGSVQLSPQELRQALHPGPFVDFIDDTSGQLNGFRQIFKANQPDFRMRDAELMVRYFGFHNFLGEYTGNLKAFLDLTAQRLNSTWNEDEHELRRQAEHLEGALESVFQIFGDNNAFKKWDGDQYETRFNRAVYDIMTFYLSNERVRQRALRSPKQLERSFQALCVNDREFLRSLETTTKSIEATVRRLKTWGLALKKVVKIPIRVPEQQGTTILY